MGQRQFFDSQIWERSHAQLLHFAKGHYREYPTDRREEIGAEAGNATNRVINCWRISTDTGCAFIALDGLTAVYEMFPDQELKELIEEIIHSFIQIDYKGLKLQTHATLTALRGILRYYNIVKEESLLAYVERVFQDYLDTALTANFANYNWFERPTWTEPCAIVDSFIVAVELWKYMQDPVYLEVAHKIYFNGMGYAQRPNGGFGCDNCAGPKVDYIRPEDFSFEAYWCCTMRGGDGLARAAEYSYLVEEDALYVPFYHNSRATVEFDDGQIILKQQTGYPYEGSVCFQVESSDVTTKKKIRLYLPQFAVPDSGRIFVNDTEIPVVKKAGFVEVDRLLQTGDVIELMFDMSIYEEALRNTALKHKKQWFHGPLLLGTKNWKDTSARDLKSFSYMGQGAYESSVIGEQWRPINEITFMDTAEARKDKLLICFEG